MPPIRKHSPQAKGNGRQEHSYADGFLLLM
jgi:hypothetical protein